MNITVFNKCCVIIALMLITISHSRTARPSLTSADTVADKEA